MNNVMTWTIGLGLIALTGCHDFTITLDDGPGIDVGVDGTVTVAVDDGHEEGEFVGSALAHAVNAVSNSPTYMEISVDWSADYYRYENALTNPDVDEANKGILVSGDARGYCMASLDVEVCVESDGVIHVTDFADDGYGNPDTTATPDVTYSITEDLGVLTFTVTDGGSTGLYHEAENIRWDTGLVEGNETPFALLQDSLPELTPTGKQEACNICITACTGAATLATQNGWWVLPLATPASIAVATLAAASCVTCAALCGPF